MNDLGRLYYENPNDDAFAWGAVYSAAIALAMLPDATIENVTYAFALFKATRANIGQSVIIVVNRGYDTDCTAASAGALCGAFSGTK